MKNLKKVHQINLNAHDITEDELMAKIVDVVYSMTNDFDKHFYYDEEEVKRSSFNILVKMQPCQNNI